MEKLKYEICLVLILLSLFPFTEVLSQTFTVQGNVSTDSTVVRYAKVIFIDQSDISKRYTAITDSFGNYQLNVVTDVKDEPSLPQSFELGQNYPNPFSSATTIPYNLNKPLTVSIKIYDILGQEVKSFELGEQETGLQKVVWDGRNNFGNEVVPGIYFYQIAAGKEIKVRKMLSGLGALILNIFTQPIIKNSDLKKDDTSLLIGTFTVEITNTDTAEPKIQVVQFENIIILSDTLIDFIVENVKDEILYIRSPEDVFNWSVYLMDIDGTYHLKITDSVYSGTGIARWSLDGQWVAYEGLGGINMHPIYIVKYDGTGKRIVTLWKIPGGIEPHPDGGIDPAWSHDGRQIAFTRCVSCEVGLLNTEIFVIDIDTSEGIKETILTNSHYVDYLFDWSWSENKLLFWTDSTDNNIIDPNLYTMNPDGSTIERISANIDSFEINAMRFSPDGNQIAFVAQYNQGHHEIYIMNKDGSNIYQVTNLQSIIRGISWSPDGNQIIFKEGEPFWGGQLYMIDKDGTGLHQITSGPSIYTAPDWRPYNIRR